MKKTIQCQFCDNPASSKDDEYLCNGCSEVFESSPHPFIAPIILVTLLVLSILIFI